MNFIDSLNDQLAPLHLLKHPFYEAWMAGQLNRAQLQYYSEQYFPFVRDFPCFVSATHSLCGDFEARRYLVENLAEEEGFPKHSSHPELWIQFAEGLGVSKEQLASAKIKDKARELVATFHRLCRSSYGEGLAALYAYEYQSPQIATSKIEGLKKHFGVTDAKTLTFFSVHESADQLHSATASRLLNELPAEERSRAASAASEAAQALWDFLTAVNEGSAHLKAAA